MTDLNIQNVEKIKFIRAEIHHAYKFYCHLRKNFHLVRHSDAACARYSFESYRMEENFNFYVRVQCSTLFECGTFFTQIDQKDV